MNAAQCLNCGHVIVSQHRHDFVTCRCGGISVDGGDAYRRRVGNRDTWKEITTPEEYQAALENNISSNPLED